MCNSIKGDCGLEKQKELDIFTAFLKLWLTTLTYFQSFIGCISPWNVNHNSLVLLSIINLADINKNIVLVGNMNI